MNKLKNLLVLLLIATMVLSPVLGLAENMEYEDANDISSWARAEVARGTELGIVEGSNNRFDPKGSITRAAFTKIMVSILDIDTNIAIEIDFSDVNEKHWHYPYVNVGYKAGIIKGLGSKFDPDGRITREQMAAIIVRSLDLNYEESNLEIKDLDKVSSWAKEDVKTAMSLGLLEGDRGYFDPKSYATREMATVVAMRAYDYLNDNEAKVDEELEYVDIKKVIKETGNYLKQTVESPLSMGIPRDWVLLGLTRSNLDVSKSYGENYYKALEETLVENEGEIPGTRYTDYSKAILLLAAIGEDPTDVAGYDIRESLADFENISRQGIMGPIITLQAFDSKNYDIPVVEGVKLQTTRELLIDFILGREVEGGGWELGSSPKEADADVTAMVIQSLTPYYTNNPDVKEAIDRGIIKLSKLQKANGGYESMGAGTSESIAQVIIALTGLNIDPHEDPRFIKNGNSTIDALMTYKGAEGGFYHVKAGQVGNNGAQPGIVDGIATEQAMHALVAYDRLINGQNRLYDMTDVK